MSTSLSICPEMRWGWRLVNPDFTSRNGFRWPFPGGTAVAAGPFTSGDPCPSYDGDGICVAKTLNGARSGGHSINSPALVVGFLPDDVCGEDESKVRVRRALVAEVVSAVRLLCYPLADLRSADLRSANLCSADLRSADLRLANLCSADLRLANLSGALFNRWTAWPDGFDPTARGAIKVRS